MNLYDSSFNFNSGRMEEAIAKKDAWEAKREALTAKLSVMANPVKM